MEEGAKQTKHDNGRLFAASSCLLGGGLLRCSLQVQYLTCFTCFARRSGAAGAVFLFSVGDTLR